MRWMWIDTIVTYEPDRRLVAIKNVSLAEEHLHEHFPAKDGLPAQPVMPASLMIEGMAQTAGVMCIALTSSTPKKVFFMTIDKAKFRKPVLPGDTVEYHMNKIANRRTMWWYRGEAKVNGQVVAEAEVGAMISDA